MFGQHEEVASNDACLALPISSLLERKYSYMNIYVVASVLGDSGTAVKARNSVALIVETENNTELILETSVSISHPSAITGGRFIPGVPVLFSSM